jgi:Protein of unknown function (DUF1353)
MVGSSIEDTSWKPWVVAPGSGFEVHDPRGAVGLIQINGSQFLVTQPFRFTDTDVEQRLVDELVSDGKDAQQARSAVDDARSFTPSENPSDLASIPRFMRWFESSYGAHTLAAVLHDDLIVDEPNGGPLGSDTLSDSFFREMMKAAGVPWLKRWIMWAAVALRSRWAAGGIRRASVVVWIVLSSAGITAFLWAGGSALLDWKGPGLGVLLSIALLLPFAAAVLWGKQYGAGIVAAAAALWILPAAAFAGIGYLIYLGLERVAKAVGLR